MPKQTNELTQSNLGLSELSDSEIEMICGGKKSTWEKLKWIFWDRHKEENQLLPLD